MKNLKRSTVRRDVWNVLLGDSAAHTTGHILWGNRR